MFQKDAVKKFGDWIGLSDHYNINLLFPHRFYLCTNAKTSNTYVFESFNNSANSNFKELSILKSSNHPNLLKIHDVRKTSNNFYVVYENFADNYQTLEKYISEKENALSEEEIVYIIEQILAGLLELNRLSLVLRTITPNSVILYEEKWKIADYKTIKYIEDIDNMRQKYSNSIVFPHKSKEIYLAPELKNQEYGVNCDVYSLGKIFLALFIGPSKLEKLGSQNINLQDLALKEGKIPEDKIQLLQGLLDENFFNRPTPKKLSKLLKNFTSKRNCEKTVSQSQIINEKALKNKKDSHSVILSCDKNQSNFEKIKVPDSQIDGTSHINLKGFQLLAEYIYKKIEEISKINSEIYLLNKNKKIYELVYILSHLELAVHFQIHKAAENEKKMVLEYQEIKNKNEKLTELLLETKQNFHPNIRPLLKKKIEFFSLEELNTISLFIKEFIDEAITIESHKKTHIFLRFLEGLAWLVSKKMLAKGIYQNKFCDLKADFIDKLKNRLRKEEEEINKDKLISRINKFIKG